MKIKALFALSIVMFSAFEGLYHCYKLFTRDIEIKGTLPFIYHFRPSSSLKRQIPAHFFTKLYYKIIASTR